MIAHEIRRGSNLEPLLEEETERRSDNVCQSIAVESGGKIRQKLGEIARGQNALNLWRSRAREGIARCSIIEGQQKGQELCGTGGLACWLREHCRILQCHAAV